jgi:hypothetical protein
VTRIVKKQHKFDFETTLTPQECTSLGIGEEVRCATCGKLISFGIYMSKSNYQYKRNVNGRQRYYCKYSCQTKDEKKDPPDKKYLCIC